MPPGPSRADSADFQGDLLRREADRCVKCGMCLAECPTYRLAADENESPRGRIALIEGLASGVLAPGPGLEAHLDNCLLCRRCERVCPSQVRYGFLMEQAREHLPGRGGTGLGAATQYPRLYAAATRAARLLPEVFSSPLGGLHLAHRLARALPDSGPAPAAGEYAPLTEARRGRVGLFPGCATAVQQGGALRDALLLLRHAGYAVEVPGDAACCGALAGHHGDHATARRLADANRRAFAAGLDAVVSIASGCGVQLDSYRPALAAPHLDVCRFLLESGSLATTDFRPLPQRVLLHTPCTVENVYRGARWAHELLALVPGIEVVDVGEPGQCCGSAGDYMLRHRETAVRLRQPILDRAARGDAAILLSTNIGCALHVAEGLGQGRAVEVLHPVQLLARQLAVSGD